MAMVMAKPSEATPRTAPVMAAELRRSRGSKKVDWRSLATLERRAKLMPAVISASRLTRNSFAWSYLDVDMDDRLYHAHEAFGRAEKESRRRNEPGSN